MRVGTPCCTVFGNPKYVEKIQHNSRVTNFAGTLGGIVETIAQLFASIFLLGVVTPAAKQARINAAACAAGVAISALSTVLKP